MANANSYLSSDVLDPGERFIRQGGNHVGKYRILCTGRFHWRLWGDGHQNYVKRCDCKRAPETV